MTDARVERNSASVQKLVEHLRHVIAEPSEYLNDTALRNALKSQGELARYKDDERGILGTSLNTLKRIAPTLLTRGFHELDELRRACSRATLRLEISSSRNARPTKIALEERNSELLASNRVLCEDLLLMTKLLQDSLDQGKAYAARAGVATQELCRREQREILLSMGLRKSSPPLKLVKGGKEDE